MELNAGMDSPMTKTAANATLFWRSCAASLVAILCIGWAFFYYSPARETARWQRKLRQTDLREVLEQEPPNNAPTLRSLARIHERNMFPPRYSQARRLLQQAITANPLQSVLWMDLARCEFFLGNPSTAKAALLRSDQLDPQYPSQRIEAIRLWHLLEEPERAKALAVRLGRVTGSAQISVIRELIASGYSPADVYELLRFATLAPDSLAALVRHLRVENSRLMNDLFRKIPASAYDHEAFRHEAIRIALNPLLPEVIHKAWRAETHVPAQPVGENENDEQSLLAVNLDLSSPAFSSALPLGWQNVSEVPWIAASWIAPTSPGSPLNSPGHIRLVFDDSPARPTAPFRWLFYRLIVPPDSPLDVRADIQLLEPNRNVCRLAAVVNQRHSHRSLPASDRTSDWQALLVSLPPQSDWSLLELYLERKTLDSAQSGSYQVNLGRLALQPRRPASPPEE